MAGIREIRRNNLVALLRGYATKRAFAEAAGLAPAHVSQVVNKHREVGESIARRIEQRLHLEPGWMDQSHAPKYGKQPHAKTTEVGAPALSKEAIALATAIESLPESQRAALRAVIDSVSHTESKHKGQRRTRTR